MLLTLATYFLAGVHSIPLRPKPILGHSLAKVTMHGIHTSGFPPVIAKEAHNPGVVYGP